MGTFILPRAQLLLCGEGCSRLDVRTRTSILMSFVISGQKSFMTATNFIRLRTSQANTHVLNHVELHAYSSSFRWAFWKSTVEIEHLTVVLPGYAATTRLFCAWYFLLAIQLLKVKWFCKCVCTKKFPIWGPEDHVCIICGDLCEKDFNTQL